MGVIPEQIIFDNIVTWAMLGVIGYLVRVIVRVDHSMAAMEVRLTEHERRLNSIDIDLKAHMLAHQGRTSNKDY